MGAIETHVEGIGHLLSDRRLEIPNYQRSYSWGEDEVTELWRDLTEAFEAGAEEYFLGPVVFTPEEGSPQRVIDGQQRLATCALLIAAVRDVFAQRADRRADQIANKYLGEPDLATQRAEQKLRLNDTDNAIFRDLTLLPPDDRTAVAAYDPTRSPTSHGRLLWTYGFFLEKVQELSRVKAPRSGKRRSSSGCSSSRSASKSSTSASPTKTARSSSSKR